MKIGVNNNWIHTDGHTSKSSDIGKFLNRWIVTRWIFRKVYGISLNQTVMRLKNVAEQTFDEANRQKILHSCDVLEKFADRSKTHKTKIQREIRYIRVSFENYLGKQPVEMLRKIFELLPLKGLIAVNLVSKEFHKCANEMIKEQKSKFEKLAKQNIEKIRTYLSMTCGSCAEMAGNRHWGSFGFDQRGNIVRLEGHDPPVKIFKQTDEKLIKKEFYVLIRNCRERVVFDQENRAVVPLRSIIEEKSNIKVTYIFNLVVEMLNTIAVNAQAIAQRTNVTNHQSWCWRHPWIVIFQSDKYTVEDLLKSPETGSVEQEKILDQKIRSKDLVI